MKRRAALKGIVIFAGGLLLLPSCLTDAGKASISLQHLDISADDEHFLANLVETILPATNTAGAKELGLHLFVLKMLDDLYPKPDQKAFMDGMAAFQKMAKNRVGQSFSTAPASQQQEVIAQVNAGRASKNVQAFYGIVKEQTIKGYLNSQLVMTQLRVYELVPGRYNPLFPVTTKTLT